MPVIQGNEIWAAPGLTLLDSWAGVGFTPLISDAVRLLI